MSVDYESAAHVSEYRHEPQNSHDTERYRIKQWILGVQGNFCCNSQKSKRTTSLLGCVGFDTALR